MLKLLGAVVFAAAVLAGAAYTKPSRDDLHSAAAKFASDSAFMSSVATKVTGLFGNDRFDDYMFFDRYRVYVGKTTKVDCYGVFGKTFCSAPKPPATKTED